MLELYATFEFLGVQASEPNFPLLITVYSEQ